MADTATQEQNDMPPLYALRLRLAHLTARTDWMISIALFVFVSSLYFATTSGITSSNDGSHYALTRAMVEKRTFEIDAFDEYAEGNDIARRGERMYSDRPPGTALAASLFYVAGGALPAPLETLASRYDAGNPRLLYVMLLPVWAGAGTVVLLYLTLRQLEVSPAGALMASLALALGSVHWKYSSVLFSHALSSFTVLLALYLALRISRTPAPSRAGVIGLGFVLGYGVLVEYSNAILVVVVMAYLLIDAWPDGLGRLGERAGLLCLGGLAPAGFLAYYNSVNFGGPLTTSYTYAINYPWAGQFSSTFNFPLLDGLQAMLIWGEGGGWCNPTCYNQGLFLLSPVLILSFFGLVPFFRRSRPAFGLATGLFVIYLALFAKHRTFHGFTADGRYLVPFLGLWAMPLSFFFDRAWLGFRRSIWRTVLDLFCFALFFLSWRNMFLHIGFSYNYHLELGQLDPMIARPENWSYLVGQVWPNGGNMPLLWGLDIVVLGAGWLWHWISRRKMAQPQQSLG